MLQSCICTIFLGRAFHCLTILKKRECKKQFTLAKDSLNRPFARSGHMVRNKLHWDANYAVGLSKQRKVGLDWCEFLCFGSPTA